MPAVNVLFKNLEVNNYFTGEANTKHNRKHNTNNQSQIQTSNIKFTLSNFFLIFPCPLLVPQRGEGECWPGYKGCYAGAEGGRIYQKWHFALSPTV